MKDYFYKFIRSKVDAKSFLCHLHSDGLMFHLDDAPETIISSITNERLFTSWEVAHLKDRVSEVFRHMGGDPFSYCLWLEDPETHPLRCQEGAEQAGIREDLQFVLGAIEGYLASRAGRGDNLAGALRKELLGEWK